MNLNPTTVQIGAPHVNEDGSNASDQFVARLFPTAGTKIYQQNRERNEPPITGHCPLSRVDAKMIQYCDH